MTGLTQTAWDDGLEEAPRRIAEIDHTPLRVLAGPGTGKTFALIRRAARLLSEGVTPSRILVCTFTRTAAADLRKELTNLGVNGAAQVYAGTLHAFCFSLLSRTDVLLLTDRVPRPLLKFEERFLLEDLEAEGLGGISARRKRLDAFNAAWARLQTDEPGWPTEPIDRTFHAALVGWLRFHEAMLIGELVPETLRYLRENPASPDRTAYDHVLVDEYQDLNRAEQKLLDLLSEAGNIAVIGDEDQSVYSFKYAHPEGISTFDQTHIDTHDEELEECRRCPEIIIEMANSLIENNNRINPIMLRPRGGNPAGEVLVLQWRNIEEEAQGIAHIIQDRVQRNQVVPGRILVLSPRRQFGYAIRDALNSLEVHAHSFFHEEALDGNPKNIAGCDAQQAFTLLTLLANLEDRVALRCWCGFGSTSLQKGEWKRLREHCERTGISPRTALEQLISGQMNLAHVTRIIARYRELQRKLMDLANTAGLELVDSLFPGNEAWASSFRSLAANIDGDDYDAKKLRESLRIGITQPELPTDVDYVRIMSLHKSKGLTADMVIVVGCMEGLIPHIRDDSDLERNRSLEEQRRLFYVAITRTRETLVLSSVTELPRGLAHRMRAHVGRGNETHALTIASRFLSELGPARPAAVLGTTMFGENVN